MRHFFDAVNFTEYWVIYKKNLQKIGIVKLILIDLWKISKQKKSLNKFKHENKKIIKNF